MRPSMPWSAPFFLFHRSGVDQPERPPLELIGVFGSENFRVGDRGRLADYLIRDLSKGRAKPMLH